MMKAKIFCILVCMLFFTVALTSATTIEVISNAEIETLKSNKINQMITTDRGNNWSFTEIVSTERVGSSDLPKLAVESDGTLHVAWQELVDMGTYNSYYKMKPYNDHWTTTELINTESSGINAYSPYVAVDSYGTVHVAWDDESSYGGSGSDPDIFYKYKPKGGSWSTTEVVSTESNDISEVTSLAVESDGTVHLTWIELTVFEQTLFYTKKIPGGNWVNPEVIASGDFDLDCFILGSLAVDSNRTVHIVYSQITDYGGSGDDADIFYEQKPYEGSWTEPEVVSTESTDSSRKPSLTVEPNGTLHVVWQGLTDYGGETSGIFYKYKPFDGSWTTTEVVSTGFDHGSFEPSLAVESNGTVHVVWFDFTNYGGSGTDADIFYKCKQNGKSWKTAEVVSTESTSFSNFPDIGVDPDGTVHVVWHDGTWYGGSMGGIFYKKRRITSNNPPNAPEQPSGPTMGDEEIEYTFSSMAIDPDGDNISYRFYWRGMSQNEYSDWTEFVPSGTTVNVSFTWTEHGVYEIGVRAIDSNYDISDCSEPLTITINETPALEVIAIEGWPPWLFAVFARIRNACYIDLNDVHLSISVKGGILKLIDKTTEYTQDILPAGGGMSIRARRIFGFGRITVNVTASVLYNDEEIVATKTVTGFVIGPFALFKE